jgi:hypothetical protein
MEISKDVPPTHTRNTKNRITIGSWYAMFWVHNQRNDSLHSRDTCTPMFIAASFFIAKLWKKPQ